MPDDVRLVTMTPPDLVARIDRHMWAAQLRNRSHAVRDLLERGWETSPAFHNKPADPDAPPPRSPFDPVPAGVPLPHVRVNDEDYVGPAPMLLQWLNSEIQATRRLAFTEDELFRGPWRKPATYILETGDRAQVRSTMSKTGWRRTSERGSLGRGEIEHVWTAPEAP